MFQPEGKSYQFGSSPYGSHTKIIKYVGTNKKVLDVGMASGYLAKKFKNNGCSVVGIEIDKENARLAKHYCSKIITGDVEQIRELPYEKGFFDVLVFADILEHLKRPDLVLTNFKKYLNPEGFVVASLPNVARLDVRLKLLFGRFNYEEGGILDKTHLRFFTLSTAKALFTTTGYRMVHFDYTGLISRFKIFKSLAKLSAFQFIIIAKVR